MQLKRNSRAFVILPWLVIALISVVALMIVFWAKTHKETVTPPEPIETEIVTAPPVIEPNLNAEKPADKEPLVIPGEKIKLDAPEEEPLPEETPEPVQNSRYADVVMSDEERELMAEVIYLEAGNQSAEGQQAVAEVILNRVIHSGFPNNVHDVLWEQGQFAVMPNLFYAAPGQAQYDAIDGALYGGLILDADVVFFSRGIENDRIWGRIGDHVFCREYIWG